MITYKAAQDLFQRLWDVERKVPLSLTISEADYPAFFESFWPERQWSDLEREQLGEGGIEALEARRQYAYQTLSHVINPVNGQAVALLRDSRQARNTWAYIWVDESAKKNATSALFTPKKPWQALTDQEKTRWLVEQILGWEWFDNLEVYGQSLNERILAAGGEVSEENIILWEPRSGYATIIAPKSVGSFITHIFEPLKRDDQALALLRWVLDNKPRLYVKAETLLLGPASRSQGRLVAAMLQWKAPEICQALYDAWVSLYGSAEQAEPCPPGQRCYVWYSKAYPQQVLDGLRGDYLDEIQLGVGCEPEGDRLGDMRGEVFLRWDNYGPRLESYFSEGKLALIASWKDLWEALNALNEPTPEQVCEILNRLGFYDRTLRVRQQVLGVER